MQENKQVKVLLVDDEESFVRALSERLGSRNLSTEAVFGGRQALEFIDREEPDIMILDLKMPDMDGMEVLRRVKKSYPGIQTIILSGYGTDADKKEASRLGAFDFLSKPADINTLTAKIRTAFAVTNYRQALYSYGDFVPLLQKHLDREGISLGNNALGIKCFCRDDNQDQLGYLLMGNGGSSGWFDMNAFGAFPAGRGIESLGPPSHHIPELQADPWTVVFHATHVGCDSQYTLGMTERYGRHQSSSSCGLIAAILARHHDRRHGIKPDAFKDFEMSETEQALMPFLEEISNAAHPMASGAEKLLELGSDIFDSLLREAGNKYFYIGGINVDYDAEHPENNFFVPKTLCVYENGAQRALTLQ